MQKTGKRHGILRKRKEDIGRRDRSAGERKKKSESAESRYQKEVLET